MEKDHDERQKIALSVCGSSSETAYTGNFTFNYGSLILNSLQLRMHALNENLKSSQILSLSVATSVAA